MGFDVKTKNRSWMITCHISNFEKAGLSKEKYEDPKFLASFLSDLWVNSGTDRKCAVSICESKEGLYHAHIAAYGNLTTLKKVSDIFYQSHVEPQLGGKNALSDYLEKKPPYDEKGEVVLFSCGIENIEDKQGNRSDVKIIEEKLNNGEKPNEILESSFSFRRYERSINEAFIDKKIKETPLIKTMRCEYIYGPSGSGKTHVYTELAEKEGAENIYLMTDYQNGGLDNYMRQGAPHILFIDEFKGNMRFETLLSILDVYSRNQIHCRYSNCYALWDTVIITSVYPPNEVYKKMVDEEDQDIDEIKQLLRRLTTITYKWKKNGEYFSRSMTPSEYAKRCLPKQSKPPEKVGKGYKMSLDQAVEASKPPQHKKKKNKSMQNMM